MHLGAVEVRSNVIAYQRKQLSTNRVIEVRELRKRFGPALALDGMTFTALPGRVTGFAGPNGPRWAALTRLEFELLVHLGRAPHRVFTREELLGSIWGFRSAGATRTVDTHASRLRAKLRGASDRDWIVAVRGVGYRLI